MLALDSIASTRLEGTAIAFFEIGEPVGGRHRGYIR
jgi:hypothetical protein